MSGEYLADEPLQTKYHYYITYSSWDTWQKLRRLVYLGNVWRSTHWVYPPNIIALILKLLDSFKKKHWKVTKNFIGKNTFFWKCFKCRSTKNPSIKYVHFFLLFWPPLRHNPSTFLSTLPPRIDPHKKLNRENKFILANISGRINQ